MVFGFLIEVNLKEVKFLSLSPLFLDSCGCVAEVNLREVKLLSRALLSLYSEVYLGESQTWLLMKKTFPSLLSEEEPCGEDREFYEAVHEDS